MPWPDENARDNDMLEAIRNDRLERVGRDPDRLLQQVEAALFPYFVSPERNDDFVSDAEMPVLQEQLQVLRKPIDKVLAAAKLADLPTTTLSVDPVYYAAFQTLGHLGPNAVQQFVDAFSTIVGIAKVSSPPKRRGRDSIEDAAARLVEVVGHYARWADLPLPIRRENHWDSQRARGAKSGSRRSDEEVVPRSAAAELLTRIRNAYRLDADNVLLQNLLHRWLVASSNDPPTEPRVSDVILGSKS